MTLSFCIDLKDILDEDYLVELLKENNLEDASTEFTIKEPKAKDNSSIQKIYSLASPFFRMAAMMYSQERTDLGEKVESNITEEGAKQIIDHTVSVIMNDVIMDQANSLFSSVIKTDLVGQSPILQKALLQFFYQQVQFDADKNLHKLAKGIKEDTLLTFDNQVAFKEKLITDFFSSFSKRYVQRTLQPLLIQGQKILDAEGQ